MKSKLRPLLAALLTAVVVVPLLIIALAAPKTTLYLSPASQSVQKGSQFAVQVRVNTSGQVHYAEIDIRFPAQILSVVGLSSAGSDFNLTIEETYDNDDGQIELERNNQNGSKTGSLLVATITFQAKNSGTANVNFRSSSETASSQITDFSSGSYNVTTPVAPTTPVTTQPPPTTTSKPKTTTAVATTTPVSEPAPTTEPTPTPTSGTDSFSGVPDEFLGGSITPNPAKRNYTGVILAGTGVLLSLGALGGGLFLAKRRRPSGNPAKELSPEQTAAELASSLLPRETPDEASPEHAPEAAPLPPNSARPAAPPQFSPRELPVPQNRVAPPQQRVAPLATAEQPPAVPAKPDLSSEALPTGQAGLAKVEDPPDMFDTAEAQYHYNEKFKTPPKTK